MTATDSGFPPLTERNSGPSLGSWLMAGRIFCRASKQPARSCSRVARVMLNANAILWRVFRFSVSGDMRKEPPPLATIFCSHRFQPNYSRGLCDEKEVKKEYVPTSHLLPVGDCILEDLSDAPAQAGAESLNIHTQLSKSPSRSLLRTAPGLPWPPDACPLDNAQQFWKGCLRGLFGEERGRKRPIFSAPLINCNEIRPNICYNM